MTVDEPPDSIELGVIVTCTCGLRLKAQTFFAFPDTPAERAGVQVSYDEELGLNMEANEEPTEWVQVFLDPPPDEDEDEDE